MKPKISIRLDEELLERLKKVAEKENRTMTNLIETTLLAVFPEEVVEEDK